MTFFQVLQITFTFYSLLSVPAVEATSGAPNPNPSPQPAATLVTVKREGGALESNRSKMIKVEIKDSPATSAAAALRAAQAASFAAAAASSAAASPLPAATTAPPPADLDAFTEGARQAAANLTAPRPRTDYTSRTSSTSPEAATGSPVVASPVAGQPPLARVRIQENGYVECQWCNKFFANVKGHQRGDSCKKIYESRSGEAAQLREQLEGQARSEGAILPTVNELKAEIRNLHTAVRPDLLAQRAQQYQSLQVPKDMKQGRQVIFVNTRGSEQRLQGMRAVCSKVLESDVAEFIVGSNPSNTHTVEWRKGNDRGSYKLRNYYKPSVWEARAKEVGELIAECKLVKRNQSIAPGKDGVDAKLALTRRARAAHYRELVPEPNPHPLPTPGSKFIIVDSAVADVIGCRAAAEAQQGGQAPLFKVEGSLGCSAQSLSFQEWHTKVRPYQTEQEWKAQEQRFMEPVKLAQEVATLRNIKQLKAREAGSTEALLKRRGELYGKCMENPNSDDHALAKPGVELVITDPSHTKCGHVATVRTASKDSAALVLADNSTVEMTSEGWMKRVRPYHGDAKSWLANVQKERTDLEAEVDYLDIICHKMHSVNTQRRELARFYEQNVPPTLNRDAIKKGDRVMLTSTTHTEMRSELLGRAGTVDSVKKDTSAGAGTHDKVVAVKPDFQNDLNFNTYSFNLKGDGPINVWRDYSSPTKWTETSKELDTQLANLPIELKTLQRVNAKRKDFQKARESLLDEYLKATPQMLSAKPVPGTRLIINRKGNCDKSLWGRTGKVQQDSVANSVALRYDMANSVGIALDSAVDAPQYRGGVRMTADNQWDKGGLYILPDNSLEEQQRRLTECNRVHNEVEQPQAFARRNKMLGEFADAFELWGRAVQEFQTADADAATTEDQLKAMRKQLLRDVNQLGQEPIDVTESASTAAV